MSNEGTALRLVGRATGPQPDKHSTPIESRSTIAPTMLGRYSIVRGAPASTLPRGIRQDTRKHTRHPLRPTTAMVTRLLAHADDDDEWRAFADGYSTLLSERFAGERGPFDALAELARTNDVWLGCNCPTAKNPDVNHCHTVLALAFMRARYPDLDVRMPKTSAPAP